MSLVESHEPDKDDYLGGRSRIRISDLQEAKKRGQKWTMLTSYDSISARIFDHAKIDCLLIGDSAAQTVYGYKTTLTVTMDELIPLAKAVANSCERALVVADMPFGSYQESPQVALRNAVRFMKEAGVHAIKLEGGQDYAEHVRLLTKSGIPVMGHIGFTPQCEHALGGYRVQGRDEKAFSKIRDDALALQEAGAFAIVLEMVPSSVGSRLTSDLIIPTIGIGAGPQCDAQVLVWQDMAGFSAPKNTGPSYLSESPGSSTGFQSIEHSQELQLAKVPKFVKRYFNMSELLYRAAVAYRVDVSTGVYPAKEHCYK